MTPLEMIAEWRRGCSNGTPDAPETCEECTRALIDALERALLASATGDCCVATIADAVKLAKSRGRFSEPIMVYVRSAPITVHVHSDLPLSAPPELAEDVAPALEGQPERDQ